MFVTKPKIHCTIHNKAYLGTSYNISCDVEIKSSAISNSRYLRNNRRFEEDERHTLIQKGPRYLVVIKNVSIEDAGVWEMKSTLHTQRKFDTSEFITLEVGK